MLGGAHPRTYKETLSRHYFAVATSKIIVTSKLVTDLFAANVFKSLSLCVSSCPGNVFVVSLAFADLVVAFYPYPLVLYALFHDGWALGNTQCMVRRHR